MSKEMMQFADNDEVYEMYKKEGLELVIYKTKVYDITKFIRMHPGGRKVIEQHMGKPIDEPFDLEEHSDVAKSYFGGKVP